MVIEDVFVNGKSSFYSHEEISVLLLPSRDWLPVGLDGKFQQAETVARRTCKL